MATSPAQTTAEIAARDRAAFFAQSDATTSTQSDAPTNATAISTSQICTVCEKAALSRCSRCSDGADMHGGALATYYCSKHCQSSHWSIHKTECKAAIARDRLYRAGVLAMTFCHLSRRANWRQKIESMAIRNDHKLHVVESALGPQDDVHYELPDSLLDSKTDRRALLVHGAGKEFLALGHGFLVELFKGTGWKVRQVVFQPTRPGVVVIHGSHDPPAEVIAPHYLLAITTKDGSDFAFDPTCLQYGIEHPVLP